MALFAGCSYPTGIVWGYLQKLSRKGWLCKTFEGELDDDSPGRGPTPLEI